MLTYIETDLLNSNPVRGLDIELHLELPTVELDLGALVDLEVVAGVLVLVDDPITIERGFLVLVAGRERGRREEQGQGEEVGFHGGLLFAAYKDRGRLREVNTPRTSCDAFR